MQEGQELLKKALALPDKERADLASSSIESLDAAVDEDAEAVWQEEIARRLEEVRSGKVKTICGTMSGRRAVRCLATVKPCPVSRLNSILKRNRSIWRP